MSEEVLTDVSETYRSDGNYRLSRAVDGPFVLTVEDMGLEFIFYDARANIMCGEEWAVLKDDDGETVVSIKTRDDNLPHWVFEELHMIQREDRLRNVDDYEKRYTLSENRGYKGAE